ncbi:30S ribosomal protein S3, partial [Candidatus Woesearchaeota archaeon]|nr:30S ribosomal protein S3 [Candidatus Woesearchaeota archaeon]
MIERKFVAQNIKEFEIEEFILKDLRNIGHSHTKVQRTPLGEKIIIYASRPGLIVGRKGQSIKKLTLDLKKNFNLKNPQIEISEVENIYLDAQIVAEMISSSLEKFGPRQFKSIGHKTMHNIMSSGALGVEILISGKIPSSRSRTWRFYQGYLKKCGDIAITGVKKAYTVAQLKSGTVGIKVSIMPADIVLPD